MGTEMNRLDFEVKRPKVKGRVVKRSSKIRSSIYKFEFEFSFLAFAIRSVIVPQGHAFNKLHNCIVHISNTWLRALHRRPAR